VLERNRRFWENQNVEAISTNGRAIRLRRASRITLRRTTTAVRFDKETRLWTSTGSNPHLM
jgi:hypothetical protein